LLKWSEKLGPPVAALFFVAFAFWAGVDLISGTFMEHKILEFGFS
jgi:hypothetical protein